eukprot:346253-Hanusia_phi.AAC.1
MKLKASPAVQDQKSKASNALHSKSRGSRKEIGLVEEFIKKVTSIFWGKPDARMESEETERLVLSIVQLLSCIGMDSEALAQKSAES